MQIHELNNFTGTLGSGAYLAIDDGNDTGKISSQGLLAATEARIDNIIAGDAPSAAEVVDARLGADGVTYPSLGDAIRDQFTDLKSDLGEQTINLRNSANILKGYIETSLLKIYPSDNTRSTFVPVEAGETYCIQKASSLRFNVAFTSTTPELNTSIFGIEQHGTDIDCRVTAPTGATYLVLTYIASSEISNADAIFNSIMITKGNHVVPFISPLSANDQVARQNFSSFKWQVGERGGIEQGSISNEDGTDMPTPANNRVRTNGMIYGSYYIEVNSGYRLFRVAFYDEDGMFVKMDAYNTATTSLKVENEGKYSRIVFTKTDTANTIDYTDNIIKNFYKQQLEPYMLKKATALLALDVKWESGGIDSQGAEVASTIRARSQNLIKGSFHIKLNNGYIVFRIYRYSESGECLGYVAPGEVYGRSEVSLLNNGYCARIVVSKADKTSTISPEEDIVDKINSIQDNPVINGLKTNYVYDGATSLNWNTLTPEDVYSLYDSFVSEYPSVVSKSNIGTTRNVITMTVSDGSQIEIRNNYKVQGQSYLFVPILIDGNNVTGVRIADGDTFASSGTLTDANDVPLCTFSNANLEIGEPIYKYDFSFWNENPTTINGFKNETKNKIFVIGCVHGYEPYAVFGHMMFFNDLMNNWKTNDALLEIRETTDFTVIPCVNPWGLRHKTNYNAYGVDLNRNNADRFELTSQTDYRWSGPSALSEPEAVAVNDELISAFSSGRYSGFIDFHNDAVGIAGIFSANELYNDFQLALSRSLSEFYQKEYASIGKAECHFDGMPPNGSFVGQAALNGFLYSTISEYNPDRLTVLAERKKGQVESIGNTILAVTRALIKRC